MNSTTAVSTPAAAAFLARLLEATDLPDTPASAWSLPGGLRLVAEPDGVRRRSMSVPGTTSAALPDRAAPGFHLVLTCDAAPRERLLAEAELLASAGRLNPEDQPVDHDTARLLYMLVRASRIGRVLEVGAGPGVAALWLAAGLGERGTLITIERDSARNTELTAAARRAGVRVDARLGDADRLMPRLHDRFEMIVLDAAARDRADHLVLALDLLVPGGILVSHATADPGAMAAAHALMHTLPGIAFTRTLGRLTVARAE